MKPNDDNLSDLLKNWREIEPRASFEADVHRRIRLAQSEQSSRVGWGDWVRSLTWQPVLGLAMALAVSISLGLTAGILGASRPANHTPAELQFMSGGTLAGGYAKLAITEGRR